MRIIRESGLLEQSSPTALIMGDEGYRGKLGIVVPASKKAKVSREIKELEDEKQRAHVADRECGGRKYESACKAVGSGDGGVGRHQGARAVLRLGDAGGVCIVQCYPQHSPFEGSRASQC